MKKKEFKSFELLAEFVSRTILRTNVINVIHDVYHFEVNGRKHIKEEWALIYWDR